MLSRLLSSVRSLWRGYLDLVFSHHPCPLCDHPMELRDHIDYCPNCGRQEA